MNDNSFLFIDHLSNAGRIPIGNFGTRPKMENPDFGARLIEKGKLIFSLTIKMTFHFLF